MTPTATADYVDLRPIGRGASATVVAWSHDLDAPVAVRRLPALSGPALDALLDELDRWHALGGECFAPPLEAGIDPDGRVFVTRRHVDGLPLAEWTRTRPRPARHLLLGVLAEVATTLAEIHRSGLAHGAVGADNVIVETTDDGRPRAVLTDPRWGTATCPTLRADLADDTPSAEADVRALADLARATLLGHVMPHEVDDALERARSSAGGHRPGAAALALVLDEAARAPRFPSNPGGAGRPSTGGAASSERAVPLPAGIAGVSPRELDALRPGTSPPAPRRRVRIAVGIAAALALAGTAIGVVTWRATRPASAPDGPVAAAALRRPTVEFEVRSLRTAPAPRAHVQVVLSLRIANRGTERLTCPGTGCRLALVVGRLTASPQPPSGTPAPRELAIDARDLGVRTSPRRGAVTLLSANPTGTTEVIAGDLSGRTTATDLAPTVLAPGASSSPNTLVFAVPVGSEVLGLAALDEAWRLRGFDSAARWIDPTAS